MMQVSWELTARAFFDQLSKRDQTVVERSVQRLADNWEQMEHSHLRKLRGLSSKSGHPMLQLKVGRDLRVLLYRQDQSIVIVDVLRHSQIEHLRSASELVREGIRSD